MDIFDRKPAIYIQKRLNSDYNCLLIALFYILYFTFMKYPTKRIQTGMNNPILRNISEEVEEINQDLIIFCHKLIVLMYQNKGV